MPTTAREYELIKIDGPLSIVPTSTEELKGECLRVLILMGPTGSGKSAFIEALSPDKELSISRDSLDSVTQEISMYHVKNMTRYERLVILVDTPGFLDTKLSESRITKNIIGMLESLRKSAKDVYVAVFYFQPITDIRMGGSKRHAVKLLRAFAESFGADNVNVVTTMWDMAVSPKQIESAEQRFERLKKDIFNDSGKLKIQVTKFEFTLESALTVLDGLAYGWAHDETVAKPNNPEYEGLVRRNLLERIASTQQQLQRLEEDRNNLAFITADDIILLEVMQKDEQMALNALQAFLDDLYDLDPESCSSPLPRLTSFSSSMSGPIPRHATVSPPPRILPRLITASPEPVSSNLPRPTSTALQPQVVYTTTPTMPLLVTYPVPSTTTPSPASSHAPCMTCLNDLIAPIKRVLTGSK